MRPVERLREHELLREHVAGHLYRDVHAVTASRDTWLARAVLGVMFISACSPEAPPATSATYTISGSIDGTSLSTSWPIQQLFLGDPGGHVAALQGDGPFEFDDIASGTPYLIGLPAGCVFAIDSALRDVWDSRGNCAPVSPPRS